MPDVQERLARSLSGVTTEIIPYLPYLLQDLWELGSLPECIAGLISGHTLVSEKTKILDLGCGKGAVSVRLASRFKCHVKGVDIVPEFISFAEAKAEEFSVEALCEFELGDINESVKSERDYDIVILGAVGDVLGDPVETVSRLRSTLKPGGYILLDDAYGADDPGGEYPSRGQWFSAFRRAGVRLVAEKVGDREESAATNEFNQKCIIRRADELKAMHPDKAAVFDGYIRSQQAEIDELEGEITGVTWLLQAI